MKVSVRKIDALRWEMFCEVPKERVLKKQDEVLSEIARHAKIPGFRAGKAPRDLVQKAHSQTAREETLKNLIPEAYQEGIRSEKLDPIDLPAIDQVELVDGLLKFRATFDLRPVVEVKDYRGIPVARPPVEVTDEEIAKSMDYFKKGRGLDEKAELDDAFAKSMGFPSLEEFKTALKRNMELDKERQSRQDIENQLIDGLLKNATLDVPRSLVDRQLAGRVEEFSRRLKSYGAKQEVIDKKVEESRKEIQDAAEKDVRVFLVLKKVAELENISVPEGENMAVKVMEFLLKEAKWEGKA
jgi:FKBP-type peptidyl-prolyl cis-trans isomerase (trigger factor)